MKRRAASDHGTKPLARKGAAASGTTKITADGASYLEIEGFDDLARDRSIPMTKQAISRCVGA